MLWFSFAPWIYASGNWTTQSRVILRNHWTPFVIVRPNPHWLHESSRVLTALDWILGEFSFWRRIRRGHWENWRLCGTPCVHAWMRDFECQRYHPPAFCDFAPTCEDYPIEQPNSGLTRPPRG